MTRGKNAEKSPQPAGQGHLLFLGTGNAFNQDGRGSQCLWMERPSAAPFLVDVGPTTLAAAERHGADLSRIDHVFITHLHGDHICGWPFLVLREIYLERRTRPLGVIGPPGTRERLEGLAHASYEEAVADAARSFPITYTEVERDSSRGLETVRGPSFDVEPLEHHTSSIGYRFHFDGLTVGVSGDTRWCPALERLSEGCDLLVLECTCLRKPEFAHVSLEEIRSDRSRLGAKEIVLTHLDDAIARALEADPIEDVMAANDGLVLPFPGRG